MISHKERAKRTINLAGTLVESSPSELLEVEFQNVETETRKKIADAIEKIARSGDILGPDEADEEEMLLRLCDQIVKKEEPFT